MIDLIMALVKDAQWRRARKYDKCPHCGAIYKVSNPSVAYDTACTACKKKYMIMPVTRYLTIKLPT